MRNYMPKVGSLGLDMMFRTCTVQVSHFDLYFHVPFRSLVALCLISPQTDRRHYFDFTKHF
jgi:hypothetical protein